MQAIFDRRFPNGEPGSGYALSPNSLDYEEGTWGTEHLITQRKVIKRDFLVAASERERGQTGAGNRTGVEDSHQV